MQSLVATGLAAAILHDKTAALDVVQEAAVVAMNKLAEFDPRTSFAAWAGQIVRFLAQMKAFVNEKATA